MAAEGLVEGEKQHTTYCNTEIRGTQQYCRRSNPILTIGRWWWWRKLELVVSLHMYHPVQ